RGRFFGNSNGARAVRLLGRACAAARDSCDYRDTDRRVRSLSQTSACPTRTDGRCGRCRCHLGRVPFLFSCAALSTSTLNPPATAEVVLTTVLTLPFSASSAFQYSSTGPHRAKSSSSSTSPGAASACDLSLSSRQTPSPARDIRL